MKLLCLGNVTCVAADKKSVIPKIVYLATDNTLSIVDISFLNDKKLSL
jgi:hypothetical protein